VSHIPPDPRPAKRPEKPPRHPQARRTGAIGFAVLFALAGLNWAAITPETTIAIYMPGTHYGEVAARLIDNGISGETPCVIVSHATRAEQMVRWSSVVALCNEAQLPAPSILLVGWVATQSLDEWGVRLNPATLVTEETSGLRFEQRKQN